MGSRLPARLTSQIVRERLNTFLATCATDELVLDIGSGNSPYMHHFPKRIRLDLVRKADVQIVGDAQCLPFASATFGGIVSTEVLEHVPDPQRMIDELARVLRPGGRVVLTTRFIFPLHDTPGDYYRFTDAGLKHLFRQWSDVVVSAETGSWETMGVLLQRMALQCDFYAPKIVRPCLLVAARLVQRLGGLVKTQYGNVAQQHRVDDILVSGWHVVARKAR